MAEAAPLVVLSRPYSPEPVGIQPLIERLLGRRRILWVNLPPSCRYPRPLPGLRLGLQPFRRRARDHRFGFGARSDGGEASRLSVIDPPLQPGTPTGFGGATRRRVIARALRPAIDRLGAPPVVLTTLPHTAELIDTFPARRWVYYMIEHDAASPDPGLAELEAEQLRRVDAVAAATPPLGRRAAEAGHEPTILPPGIDADRWAPPEIEPPRSRAAHRLAALPEPRALYWGPPDADLDPRLLHNLAGRWRGSIALIGPHRSRSHAPSAIPGVHCLGPAPERDLPRIATLADVLILPHADGPADRIGPPPQLLPYLATGRATVCRDAPALRGWADCCDLVPPDRFADRVAQRAVTGPSAEQIVARQRRLPAESWEARVERFEALLDAPQPVIHASVETLSPRPIGPTEPIPRHRSRLDADAPPSSP